MSLLPFAIFFPTNTFLSDHVAVGCPKYIFLETFEIFWKIDFQDFLNIGHLTHNRVIFGLTRGHKNMKKIDETLFLSKILFDRYCMVFSTFKPILDRS